jgi:four helix bundle protein
MQDFHHVRVWQSAILIATKTREIVDQFPPQGYGELKAQMVSAAESISHNIAEGRAATSPREFSRYLDIAAKSTSELASQIDLAAAYGIIPKRKAFALNGTVICTRRMIRSLQETIRSDEPRQDSRAGNG